MLPVIGVIIRSQKDAQFQVVLYHSGIMNLTSVVAEQVATAGTSQCLTDLVCFSLSRLVVPRHHLCAGCEIW